MHSYEMHRLYFVSLLASVFACVFGLMTGCSTPHWGSAAGAEILSGPKTRLTVLQASSLDQVEIDTYADAARCTGKKVLYSSRYPNAGAIRPGLEGGELLAEKPITLGATFAGSGQICRVIVSFFADANRFYRLTTRISGNQCFLTLNDTTDAAQSPPVFMMQRSSASRNAAGLDQWCEAVAQTDLPQKGQRPNTPAVNAANTTRPTQVSMADLRGLVANADISLPTVAVPAPVILLPKPALKPLEPDKIFEQVSASVWQVLPFDGRQRLGLGSAVVIGPERVVTNCHVLFKANGVVLVKDSVRLVAKLEYPDPARDLCTLRVRGLQAPPVLLAPAETLRVGQKVFAIGNPLGLALTLSDGLLSALRRANDGRVELVQNSAPISSGSSGGGLFDDYGRLIGITTLAVVAREGSVAQNLNFAVPAQFLTELEQRGRANLAR